MALSTASWGHHAGNRPEDARGLDAWGREWLEKNGYTFNFHSADELKALAGTVARLRALSASAATTAEMHRVARPHLHPERAPQAKPEPVLEQPPESGKRGRKNNRTRMLKLRVSEDELADYQAWAERSGKPVADLLRRGARDELELSAADAPTRPRD